MEYLTKKQSENITFIEYVNFLMRKPNFDVESRYEYKERIGFAKGYIISIETGIEEILKKNLLSIELIADAFRVPIDYVVQIKENIGKPKKHLFSLKEPKRKVRERKTKSHEIRQAD